MFTTEQNNSSKFKIRKATNVSKDFINEIKSIENLYVGHEDYGNVIEFYDEDGIVVLTIDVQEKADEDCLVFKFPMSGKEFTVSQEDFEFKVDEDY